MGDARDATAKNGEDYVSDEVLRTDNADEDRLASDSPALAHCYARAVGEIALRMAR